MTSAPLPSMSLTKNLHTSRPTELAPWVGQQTRKANEAPGNQGFVDRQHKHSWEHARHTCEAVPLLAFFWNGWKVGQLWGISGKYHTMFYSQPSGDSQWSLCLVGFEGMIHLQSSRGKLFNFSVAFVLLSLGPHHLVQLVLTFQASCFSLPNAGVIRL